LPEQLSFTPVTARTAPHHRHKQTKIHLKHRTSALHIAEAAGIPTDCFNSSTSPSVLLLYTALIPYGCQAADGCVSGGDVMIQ
jgi:hypothetical protein